MNEKAALEKLRNAVRLKHYSLATERCYCEWLVRFSRTVRQMPANLSREQKLELFLTKLARDSVAASTQNQAFNAILFFYKQVLKQPLGDVKCLRARREATVRVAPSQESTRALLAQIHDAHGYPVRLICHLLYGCGLRVSEPLNLRVKDVCFADSRLIIRGAKGGKDRVVPLPCSLVEPLKRQLRAARVSWEQDQENSVPVPLLGRLDRKYPSARFAWQWYWVFPAHKPCRHPRTGETVRWRCHEANVQRAVKAAARKLDLDATVTPHVLRHAYATHALDAGANVRDVQSALGHAQLETTMLYTHADAMRVASPLEVVT